MKKIFWQTIQFLNKSYVTPLLHEIKKNLEENCNYFSKTFYHCCQIQILELTRKLYEFMILSKENKLIYHQTF